MGIKDAARIKFDESVIAEMYRTPGYGEISDLVWDNWLDLFGFIFRLEIYTVRNLGWQFRIFDENEECIRTSETSIGHISDLFADAVGWLGSYAWKLYVRSTMK